MMNKFIHWPNATFSLSTTCDEILSWMIEIWMKNHLVSVKNYNTIYLFSPKKLQRMTNNVGLTFSVGDTTWWFINNIEQET